MTKEAKLIESFIKQIDSDYFLPILMQRYFLQNSVGQQRIKTFFK